MRLIMDSPVPGAKGAYLAQVSYSGEGGFGAFGKMEHRGIPLAVPRGVGYLPCEGDTVVMLPVEGGEVCLGVLAQPSGKEGEYYMASSGGASVSLQSDGCVVINNKLKIDRDGQLHQIP